MPGCANQRRLGNWALRWLLKIRLGSPYDMAMNMGLALGGLRGPRMA